MMKLGCNTVLFACTDLETAVDHIAAAGYSHVELAVIKGMCEHVPIDASEGRLQAVRGLLDNAGLTPTAIEAATTDRERLDRVFGLAGALEIPIVNIGSGGISGDEESTKTSIAHVADLAELAGRHGVRLAVKPHVGQAIFDAATALRLMDEVRAPALGLNFDPSHLYRADEDPEKVVGTWGGHIITSHFRDCASRERQVGPPETQIPGRGVVDLAQTVRMLSDLGYDGPLNFEVIGAGTYTLAKAMGIAAEGRGYLNRLLQEVAR